MSPEIINHFFLIAMKIFFVLGACLYTIFSIIVVKQISNISKHIHTRLNPVLVIFSYIHLIFSLFLIFLTLVIL